MERNLNAAKVAASTFVGLMQTGDNIAIVSFDNIVEVNYPFTKITSDAIKTDAQSAINALYARNSTSIGGGIKAGQNELNKGINQLNQAIVLLTDGLENTSPWVADVLPTIPAKTDIYAIALGSDADQNLLINIANTTGGKYYFASDATKLQDIYNSIRGTITSQAIYSTFTNNITPGATKTFTSPVDGLTKDALFSLTFPSGSVGLELVSPSGRIIDTLTSDPNINFKKGTTYTFCRVMNPEKGNWTIKMIGTSLSSSVSVTATVQGTSDLTSNPFFDKNTYDAGQPILLNCILSANKEPITGAVVKATVLES